MSGHTATPWKVFSKNGVLAILSPNEQDVVHWTGFDAAQFDDATNKANAAFIVKACNAHDALVKALAIFLGGDGRFQIAVGGNPNAVEKMLAAARETLEKAS